MATITEMQKLPSYDQMERLITATSGVKSFNGRTGAVVPKLGDYPASYIGMDDGTGNTVETELELVYGKIHGNKSLGTELTTAQSNAIKNGNFAAENLFPSNYWTINGKIRRIAACDPFYKTGDNTSLGHHLMMVDDGVDLAADGSTTHYMNTTSTTEGGFVGTDLYKTYIPQILEEKKAAFGSDHLMTWREYLCDAVTNGVPSAGAWYDCQYMIFNEAMYYGTTVNGHDADGAGLFNVGIGHHIVPLFRDFPEYTNRRASFWLRDVCTSSVFASVYGGGHADRHGASTAWVGVLGYYLIH